MSHRVKNLLAIAAGLTHITSRSTSSTTEMARELTQRLTALGRAHDLVRPLPGGQGSAALLGDLLSVLLAPYDDLGAFSGRIRVAVERMGVGEAATTSLALVLHELATNSLKYRALSSGAQTLDITTVSRGGELDLIWMERGGPPVESTATSKWLRQEAGSPKRVKAARREDRIRLAAGGADRDAATSSQQAGQLSRAAHSYGQAAAARDRLM